MTQRTKTTDIATTDTPKGAQPPRIAKKTLNAIHIIATTEQTQRDVAKKLKMSEAHLCRELAKPHVRQELEAQRATQAMAFDGLKARARTIALQKAVEMLQGETSEATRVKLVELLTREAQKNAPAVQVNVAAGGYEYAPPGTRMVEITDTQSDGLGQSEPDK